MRMRQHEDATERQRANEEGRGTLPAILSFSEQLHAKVLFSRLAVKFEGAAVGGL
jgi:hypothetical protein